VSRTLAVIPAEAGIQCFRSSLDSRIRGSDEDRGIRGTWNPV